MLLPDLLTTDRLILRPHQPDDFDGFYRVITNKEATRFVQFSEDDQSRDYLEAFFQEILSTMNSSHPVFGLAILEKGSRDYVGFCGLSELPDDSGTETYYVLNPDMWGKGYATEAAQKLFEYAFSVLDLPHLDTFLVDENKASHLVAHKLGMQDLGLTDHREYSRPVRRFRVEKKAFFEL
ncbi:MAG: GNAT family N-acetyltransferase [Bacteroidia bacterium]|nr:GNAT family N-acetyltransferase [Bacteroidia bacterium]